MHNKNIGTEETGNGQMILNNIRELESWGRCSNISLSCNELYLIFVFIARNCGLVRLKNDFS